MIEKCQIIPYFAYGSNMDSKRLDERNVKYGLIGKAILSNYKLLFNKKSKKNPEVGFANVSECLGSNVEGILYSISKESMLKLDKFEGFPEHYRREFLNILVPECDCEIHAITYIANDHWIADNLRPTTEYIDRLLEAKNYLSDSYYNYILSFKSL